MPATDPVNPMTPFFNGSPISDANPLPCSAQTSGTPVTTTILSNPVTWIYNGAPVSDTNPLPIKLV